jgi:hypothetical protein
MNLQKEQIQPIAKAYLEKLDIKYLEFGEPRFKSKDDPAHMIAANYWTIDYTYMVFEEELAFVYINDDEQKAEFILTDHGRINEEILQKRREQDEMDDEDE